MQTTALLREEASKVAVAAGGKAAINPLQRKALKEVDVLQLKQNPSQLQTGTGEEDEPLQVKRNRLQIVQRVAGEKPLQMRQNPLQLRDDKDGEPLQKRVNPLALKKSSQNPLQLREASPQSWKNNTGLPDNLKAGVEALSGYSMDDVQVHYNSDKPAQLQALAYAQGTDIHVASGQEKHLPHEAWHVVQQKQGRVQPTLQMKEGIAVNDDTGLEHEADTMGARATSTIKHVGTADLAPLSLKPLSKGPLQLKRKGNDEDKKAVQVLIEGFAIPAKVKGWNTYLKKFRAHYDKDATYKNLKFNVEDLVDLLENAAKEIHPALFTTDNEPKSPKEGKQEITVGTAPATATLSEEEDAALTDLVARFKPLMQVGVTKYADLFLQSYRDGEDQATIDKLIKSLGRLAELKKLVMAKFTATHPDMQKIETRANTSSATGITNITSEILNDEQKEFVAKYISEKNIIAIKPPQLLKIVVDADRTFQIKVHYDLNGPKHGNIGTPHAQIVKEEALLNGFPCSAVIPATKGMTWAETEKVLKGEWDPQSIQLWAKDHLSTLEVKAVADLSPLTAAKLLNAPTKVEGVEGTDGYVQYWSVSYEGKGQKEQSVTYRFNSGHGYRSGHGNEDITISGLSRDEIERAVVGKLTTLALKPHETLDQQVNVKSKEVTFRYTLFDSSMVGISTYFIGQ